MECVQKLQTSELRHLSSQSLPAKFILVSWATQGGFTQVEPPLSHLKLLLLSPVTQLCSQAADFARGTVHTPATFWVQTPSQCDASQCSRKLRAMGWPNAALCTWSSLISSKISIKIHANQGFRPGELKAFRNSQFPGLFKEWPKEGQNPWKFPPHKQLLLKHPGESWIISKCLWPLVWPSQPCCANNLPGSPPHWGAGCHPAWTPCQHAFSPGEAPLQHPEDTPWASCLSAPGEQRGLQVRSRRRKGVPTCLTPVWGAALTASRRQIFFSSSTFWSSFSWRSFSFFFSSIIFSFFCSSLTSESWEPGKHTLYQRISRQNFST